MTICLCQRYKRRFKSNAQRHNGLAAPLSNRHHHSQSHNQQLTSSAMNLLHHERVLDRQ